MSASKLLVLYVPSLDRRWLAPQVTPFLSRCLTNNGAVELATHPSTELLPALVTGAWPHEHKCWQVRRKPIRPRTAMQKIVDVLPDRLTTTAACLRHLVDKSDDLPTIEPRRRRQLESIRVKMQRRQGGNQRDLHFEHAPSLFSELGRDSRYRTVFSLDGLDDGLASLVDGTVALDFIELYTLDLFCHWNIDHREALQARLAETDALIAGACEKAEALGIDPLLVVDHGHEAVTRTIDLPKVLRDSGVPKHEYLYFAEVGNARFWYDTDRARQTLEDALRQIDGATYLTHHEMAEHHVAFDVAEGFGDGYLISDAGRALFPHDFYHPLVNAYMARKTSEQAPRKTSPVHRGNHGGLPGQHPCDVGYFLPLGAGLQPTADRGELIDVAPTVLSLIKRDVPAAMRGAKVLRRG